MEENKNLELENVQNQEEQSALDFQTIYSTLILNWKWFLLSIVLCCALAVAYVKLAPKVFQSSTKILIKDDESKKSGGAAGAAAAAMSNLESGIHVKFQRYRQRDGNSELTLSGTADHQEPEALC